MADFVALAKRLIDANGRAVSIVQLSNDPEDAAKPWRGPADPRDSNSVTVSGIGAFVPISGGNLGITFQDSGPDDKVFIFPAADDEGKKLEDFDEVVDGTTRYKIQETQFLQPGAARIMYFFRLAK